MEIARSWRASPSKIADRLRPMLLCSAAPLRTPSGMLMICEACGTSEEVDDDGVMRAIAAAAAGAEFTLRRVMVEAKGLCGRCAGAG